MSENENVNDDVLDEAIETIEAYLFGKGEERGEKLFLDFAKANKKTSPFTRQPSQFL